MPVTSTLRKAKQEDFCQLEASLSCLVVSSRATERELERNRADRDLSTETLAVPFINLASDHKQNQEFFCLLTIGPSMTDS